MDAECPIGWPVPAWYLASAGCWLFHDASKNSEWGRTLPDAIVALFWQIVRKILSLGKHTAACPEMWPLFPHTTPLVWLSNGLERCEKEQLCVCYSTAAALSAFAPHSTAKHPRGHLPLASLEAVALSFFSWSTKSTPLSSSPFCLSHPVLAIPALSWGQRSIMNIDLSAFFVVCHGFLVVQEASGISAKESITII